MEKDAQDGNDDDVQGGDEARLAHGGVLDAHLLEQGGHSQGSAAADAAQNEGLAVGLFGLPLFRRLSAVKKQDDRNQGNAAHIGADGIEGERSDMIHAHGLGHEGRAPDEGGEKQNKEVFRG